MFKLFIKNAALISFIAAISACGSGSGGGDSKNSSASAKSVSFSPTTGVDEKGSNVVLHWKYTVNNGKPLTIDYNSLAMQMSLKNLTVTIDPATLIRATKLDGSISGDLEGTAIKGTVAVNSDEKITSSQYPSSTLIDTQEFQMDMNLTAQGETLLLSFSSESSYDPAFDWFLDRENLNEMGVGHIEQSNTFINGAIDIATEPDIGLNYSTPFNSSYAEQWEITEAVNSMKVGGKNYDNVIKVVRTTVVPDIQNGGTMNMDITYWVAKGIGIIKSIGQFNLLGEPITLELADTNLVAQ